MVYCTPTVTLLTLRAVDQSQQEQILFALKQAGLFMSALPLQVCLTIKIKDLSTECFKILVCKQAINKIYYLYFTRCQRLGYISKTYKNHLNKKQAINNTLDECP